MPHSHADGTVTHALPDVPVEPTEDVVTEPVIVGEPGPEVEDLPSGEPVKPTRRTAKKAAAKK